MTPDQRESYAETFKQMQSLGGDWHEYKADCPNETAVENAWAVLEEVHAADLESSCIAPSVDEGIVIAFIEGDLYADIECYNDGAIVAITTTLKENSPSQIFDVEKTDIKSSVERIKQFLKDAKQCPTP